MRKLHVLATAKGGSEAGIKDIFDVHARAFYRAAALLEGDNPGRLRLGYLKLDDEILATFSGTICHNRLLLVMCLLTGSDWQRQSSCALLIHYQIKKACAEGLAFYDFGAGHGAHKEPWADLVLPLFDSFIALKPHGLCLTLPLAGAVAAQAQHQNECAALGLGKDAAGALARRGGEATAGASSRRFSGTAQRTAAPCRSARR